VAEILAAIRLELPRRVISGIGFLGAGAVLHSHGFVSGLTTAATIWVVAGVGMALGSGMYLVAIFATAMSLVILYFLAFIEDKIQGRKSYSYALVVTDLNQALTSINKVLQDNSVAAASFNFRKKAGHYSVWFNLLIPRETREDYSAVSEVPEITQVETGSSAPDLASVGTASEQGEERERRS
jgi:putative Mg2+ transporter-C (MgtC) family protein